MYVRLLYKVPKSFPIESSKLLTIYEELLNVNFSKTEKWKCHCCKEKINSNQFVAAFVVNCVQVTDKTEPYYLYLTFICKKCLKENTDDTIFFNVFEKDLVEISSYDPSAEFIDLDIEKL